MATAAQGSSGDARDDRVDTQRGRVRRAAGSVASLAALALLGACGGGAGGATPAPPAVLQPEDTTPPAPLADPLAAPADEVSAPATAVPRWLAATPRVVDADASGTVLATRNDLVVVDGPHPLGAVVVATDVQAVFTDVRDVTSRTAAPVSIGQSAAYYAQAGRVWRVDLTQAGTLAPVAVSNVADACAVVEATPLDANGARALLEVALSAADGSCGSAPMQLMASDTPPDTAPLALPVGTRFVHALATSAGVATALLVAEPGTASTEQLAVYDTALHRVSTLAGAAAVASGTARWLTALHHTTHAALLLVGAQVQRIDWLGTTAALGASLHTAVQADTLNAVSDAHAAWIADASSLSRYDPGRAVVALFADVGGPATGWLAQSDDHVYAPSSVYTTATTTSVLAVSKADASTVNQLAWTTHCCSATSFSEYLRDGSALVEIVPDDNGGVWGYLNVQDSGSAGATAEAAWTSAMNAGAVFDAAGAVPGSRTLLGLLTAPVNGSADGADEFGAGAIGQQGLDGSTLALGTLDAPHDRLVAWGGLRDGVAVLAVVNGTAFNTPVPVGLRRVDPLAVLVPGQAGSLAVVDWKAP